MKNETLKKTVQEHFEQYELPEEKMEQLLQLQQRHLAQQSQHSKSSRLKGLKWGGSSLAMCACFVLAWLMLSPSISPPLNPADDLLGSIAHEVAKNHIKLKPLEVSGSDLQQVGAFFERLNFTPVQSSIFSVLPVQLLGGRYCSIKGEAASQLRYLDKQGKPVTLYQAVLPAVLFQQLPNTDKGEPPARLNARGVSVSIWTEKGLVMASVNEP